MRSPWIQTDNVFYIFEQYNEYINQTMMSVQMFTNFCLFILIDVEKKLTVSCFTIGRHTSK